jgi:kynurenine 3-monooxygenase
MITIVGAGPQAACSPSCLPSWPASSLYERRPDPALAPTEAGRSINLALAARGIRALREAGVIGELTPLLVPMRGRQIHEMGTPGQFMAYGQRPREMIWSVSRDALTRCLTEAARAGSGVTFHFGQQCLGYGRDGQLLLRDVASGREYRVDGQRIIGADGAGSALRHSLASQLEFESPDRLEHDCKELAVPSVGQSQLSMDALHIWPRGGSC